MAVSDRHEREREREEEEESKHSERGGLRARPRHAGRKRVVFLLEVGWVRTAKDPAVYL